MSMDANTIFNAILTIGVASIGWFAKQLWDAVQELKHDVHEIEVDLPKSYVSKNDFNQTMKHIEDMFQRIYDKLDDKVDK